jgi:hypothetical protein
MLFAGRFDSRRVDAADIECMHTEREDTKVRDERWAAISRVIDANNHPKTTRDETDAIR